MEWSQAPKMVPMADARISGIFDAGHNDVFAEGLRAYFGLQVHRVRDDLIVLTHD